MTLVENRPRLPQPLLGWCVETGRSNTFHTIRIDRLRGIKSAELSGFSRLTFLVGHPGAGKSTILEALRVAVSNQPASALGSMVARHEHLTDGIPYLFHKDSKVASWQVEMTDSVINVEIKPTVRHGWSEVDVDWSVLPTPRPTLLVTPGPRRLFSSMRLVTSRNIHGNFTASKPELWGADDTCFIKPAPSPREVASSVEELYWDACSRGGSAPQLLTQTVSDVLPGATGLELVDPGKLGQRLVVVYADGTRLPLAAAGRGVHSLIRLLLELENHHEGLILVEEPEIHQHYRTMSWLALGLWRAAQRCQVVVTTHSAELVQETFDVLPEEQWSEMTVMRVVPYDGVLRQSVFTGAVLKIACDPRSNCL